MLSFANFGSSDHPPCRKVAQAVEILQAKAPEFEVDGEMQVDVALNAEVRERDFPFCRLKGNANVLVFPDVAAANIAYKLLTNLGQMKATGPILVGMNKPAHVLQQTATVQEVSNMIYVCAHQACKVLPG